MKATWNHETLKTTLLPEDEGERLLILMVIQSVRNGGVVRVTRGKKWRQITLLGESGKVKEE